MSTILGLSRGTDTLGLLELLFRWKTAAFGRDLHRFVAVIRYTHSIMKDSRMSRLVCLVLIPSMGILLLSYSSVISLTLTGTVTYTSTYSMEDTFPVSAGIGAFNASQALLWKPAWLAYLFTLAAFTLLFDTTSSVAINPSICYGTPCVTYYFTGGLAFVDPDPFGQPSLFPNSDVIIVRKAPGLLVSYWDLNSAEVNSVNPNDVECGTFGAASEAFQICLASSNLNIDHVIAGSSPFFKPNNRLVCLSI